MHLWRILLLKALLHKHITNGMIAFDMLQKDFSFNLALGARKYRISSQVLLHSSREIP